jgi:hypothetical protein
MASSCWSQLLVTAAGRADPALGALFPLIVFTIVVNMAIGLLSVLLIVALPLAHDVVMRFISSNAV